MARYSFEISRHEKICWASSVSEKIASAMNMLKRLGSASKLPGKHKE